MKKLRRKLPPVVAGAASFVIAAIMLESTPLPAAETTQPQQQCDYNQDLAGLIAKYGEDEFHNPPEIRPTNELFTYQLSVQYGNNVLLGCNVHLRSYNGRLIGDTIRAKPGDVLYIRVTNNLPAGTTNPHPQDPAPMEHHGAFSFNITNLHTHGLHTDPVGTAQYAGDNVLLDIEPGHSQEYRIKIPDNHPAGTFWYHAHLHGSTAIQLASGMAGALIIEGGTKANGDLNVIPELDLARFKEKIFVLQQLDYDTNGVLETFDDLGIGRSWQRHTTVNGQFVPTIRMRPGEVQRWRFIHAGVAENITPALDGHKLYEVAADGISLGRMVPWPASKPLSNGLPGDLFLAPAYRSDVLVKANPLAPGESSHVYYLRDTQLSAAFSLQAQFTTARLYTQHASRELMAAIPGKPDGIIAKLVVEGSDANMSLPTDDELRDVVPASLPPITQSDLTGTLQDVRLDFATRKCTPQGDCTQTCASDDQTCVYHAMVNDHVFMPMDPPRTLVLNTASEWTLHSSDPFGHPFHIHVNPFQVNREEPDAQGNLLTRSVWKDTIVLPVDGSALTLKARYLDYVGTFVLHCHILGHEDMGMMQLVKIVAPQSK